MEQEKEEKEEKEEAVGPLGLLAGVHALIVDMNRLHYPAWKVAYKTIIARAR